MTSTGVLEKLRMAGTIARHQIVVNYHRLPLERKAAMPFVMCVRWRWNIDHRRFWDAFPHFMRFHLALQRPKCEGRTCKGDRRPSQHPG